MLDLRTGTIEGSVPYEKDTGKEFWPEHLAGGWNPVSEHLAITGFFANDAEGGSDYLKTFQSASLVLSLHDGTSDVVEGMGSANVALFQEDGTLLLEGYDSDALAGTSNRLIDSHLLQTSQIPYTTRVLCLDLGNMAVRWTLESPVYQVSEYNHFFDLGTTVEGYANRHVLAHCFANVCELIDAERGVVLRRWETTCPMTLVWPDEDAGFILDGVLDDGSCFALRVYEDKPQSFANPSFYVDTRFIDSEGMRITESAKGVLLSSGNVIYRYADILEGDLAQEVADGDYFGDSLYSTASGILRKANC